MPFLWTPAECCESDLRRDDKMSRTVLHDTVLHD